MPVARPGTQRQAVAGLSECVGDRLRGAGHRPFRVVVRVEVIRLVGEQAGAAERTRRDRQLYAYDEAPRITEVAQDARAGGFGPAVDQFARRHDVEERQCLTGRQRNQPEQGPPYRWPSGRPSACAPWRDADSGPGRDRLINFAPHRPGPPRPSGPRPAHAPCARPPQDPQCARRPTRRRRALPPRHASAAAPAASRRNAGSRPSLIHRLPCLPTHPPHATAKFASPPVLQGMSACPAPSRKGQALAAQVISC